MEILVIALLITAISIGALMEVTYLSVYGFFLSDKEVGPYLDKYLSQTRLNQFGTDMLVNLPKYVSKNSFSILARWHVEDYGVIPRWSKWSKVLDARHKELLKIQGYSKKLSTL